MCRDCRDWLFLSGSCTSCPSTLFLVNILGHIINEETNTKNIGDITVDAQYIPT